MARRVVITGIGLICSLGSTTGTVWQALLAGKSGVGRITAFDASAFACQIAAEVRNFDPLNFIEKKEVKKMGRFIHFAIAASEEAMKMSQLQVTPSASFVDDLGADSLETVELVMSFEEAFDIEIPDEDAEKIRTVADAVEYIGKNAKAGK